MLNEGTSGKRAEEEIGSSWGLQHDSWRSVCTGPEGWAGFKWVKRGEKGISGELPASGKEVEIPKAMHHVFFFFFLFLSPWKETLGVCFTHVNHLLPGWSWGLEISTGGGSFSVALQNITHKAPPRMLTIQSTHSLTIHLPNGLEPLLCIS